MRGRWFATSAVALAAGKLIVSCSGAPTAHYDCQVFHHKAEIKVTSTGTVPFQLEQVTGNLYTRSGKKTGFFASGVTHPPHLKHKGDFTLVTVALTGTGTRPEWKAARKCTADGTIREVH